MVSEEERLKQELEEARQALQFQRENRHQPNEFFELETKLHIEQNDWLLYLDVEKLEDRVERLERDLRHLQQDRWKDE